MEEVRFVGVRRCPRCHETLVLLLPCNAAMDSAGKATALGVRIERAAAAFMDEGDGEPRALVRCLVDLWRKRGEVPSRFVLDREAPGLLIGTLYLRGPAGVTTVRCTPGEGVLIAVDLQLPCMIGEGLAQDSLDVFHRIAWQGSTSSLH
jgi:hypothetical protein